MPRVYFPSDREEAVKYGLLLGDYIPSKKVMKSRTGLEILLPNAYLTLEKVEIKTWYLTIENMKVDTLDTFLAEFCLEVLRDTLFNTDPLKISDKTPIASKANIKLYLSDRPELAASGTEGFIYKNGEIYFDITSMFLYNFKQVPDTIMIYLKEKRNENWFYHTPSDSVAYIRKIE